MEKNNWKWLIPVAGMLLCWTCGVGSWWEEGSLVPLVLFGVGGVVCFLNLAGDLCRTGEI